MRRFLYNSRNPSFRQSNRVNPSSVRPPANAGQSNRVNPSSVQLSLNLLARSVPQEVDTDLIDVPTAALFDAAIPINSTHQEELERRKNVIAILQAHEVSLRTDIYHLKYEQEIMYSAADYKKRLTEVTGQLEELKKEYKLLKDNHERVRVENRAMFEDYVKQTAIMQKLYQQIESLKDAVEAAEANRA